MITKQLLGITLLLITLLQGANAQQNLEKLSYEELDSLKFLHLDQRQLEAALPYIQAAKNKAQKEFEPTDSTFVVHLESLGHIYMQMSLYDKAEPLLKKAVKLGKKAFGSTHLTYANFLYNLAQMYHEKGQYELAETYYLKDIAISKKVIGEKDPNYAISISNLALLYYDMGQYERCEALNLQAIEIRREVLGEKNVDYATSLNNLASVYFQMGKYEQVEKLFLQVKEIFADVLGKEHPNYASMLNNLAFLYMNMEAYDKAEPLYVESINLLEKLVGKADPYYAKLLNNLAMLYTYTGKYEAAKKLYTEVLQLRAKVLGKQHPDYAYSLNNLGNLYMRMGQNEQAEKYYKEAIAIFETTLGIQHPAYIAALTNLADFYTGIQQWDKAEKTFFQAITANIKNKEVDTVALKKDMSLLQSYDFYSNSEVLLTLQTYYRLKKAQHDLATDSPNALLDAYTAIQTAMQINDKIRNSMSSEGDKLRILNENSQLVTTAIELSQQLKTDSNKDKIEAAFSFAEQNKSMLLADAIKGERAKTFSNLPDSVAEYETGLQQQKKELEKAATETKDQATKNKIREQQNELNLKINAFLKKLKADYPEYHQLRYANITAKANEIQALLAPKTMVLEYFVADTVTYLFALTKEAVNLIPIRQTRQELHEHVGLLRKALSNYHFIVNKKNAAYDLYVREAAFFYEHYVEQAVADQAIDQLIIVTDGALGHLPFEVFLVESATQSKTNYSQLHYLVNDYNISYNYSMTLWKETVAARDTENKKATKGILACAATYPALDSTQLSTVRSPANIRLRNKLKPLPATEKEVNTLAELFNGDFLKGEMANEAYFKNNAHQYSVIHLAMHGILDNRLPILSSLAFTDNLDSLEDNFLQAYEIAHLNLNADLVVLSACETGYGEFQQGEGIVSLARSFMYAGTASLVVSLWQVNDHSTAVIMQKFYSLLEQGTPKDEALRKAKLDYLQKANGIAGHPAYWSAFIQIGSTAPITFQNKTNYWWWVLGGGLVLLILGGILYRPKMKVAG